MSRRGGHHHHHQIGSSSSNSNSSSSSSSNKSSSASHSAQQYAKDKANEAAATVAAELAGIETKIDDNDDDNDNEDDDEDDDDDDDEFDSADGRDMSESGMGNGKVNHGKILLEHKQQQQQQQQQLQLRKGMPRLRHAFKLSDQRDNFHAFAEALLELDLPATGNVTGEDGNAIAKTNENEDILEAREAVESVIDPLVYSDQNCRKRKRRSQDSRGIIDCIDIQKLIFCLPLWHHQYSVCIFHDSPSLFNSMGRNVSRLWLAANPGRAGDDAELQRRLAYLKDKNSTSGSHKLIQMFQTAQEKMSLAGHRIWSNLLPSIASDNAFPLTNATKLFVQKVCSQLYFNSSTKVPSHHPLANFFKVVNGKLVISDEGRSLQPGLNDSQLLGKYVMAPVLTLGRTISPELHEQYHDCEVELTSEDSGGLSMARFLRTLNGPGPIVSSLASCLRFCCYVQKREEQRSIPHFFRFCNFMRDGMKTWITHVAPNGDFSNLNEACIADLPHGSSASVQTASSGSGSSQRRRSSARPPLVGEGDI